MPIQHPNPWDALLQLQPTNTTSHPSFGFLQPRKIQPMFAKPSFHQTPWEEGWGGHSSQVLLLHRLLQQQFGNFSRALTEISLEALK